MNLCNTLDLMLLRRKVSKSLAYSMAYSGEKALQQSCDEEGCHEAMNAAKTIMWKGLYNA